MLGIGLNNYSGKATVTITAIGGKTVLQVEQNMGDNNTNMVNIANLSAGVYIVSAVLDNGTSVHQKFIKQ